MENKFKEITLMNAVMCLAVIVIHLTSYPMMYMEYGGLSHICIFIINKGLCFAVPAFLFLSGLKLHNKYSGTKMSLKRFYWGRVKKIVIPYIVSVFVYFMYFYIEKCVVWSELPSYILCGSLVAHFYYIIIAIQMYLIFPLLLLLFDRFPKIVVFLSLVITVCSILFVKHIYADRFFGAYLIYLVLGMVASKYKLWEKVRKMHITSIIGAVISGAVHLLLLYKSLSGEFVYKYAELVAIVYILFAVFALYSLCLLVNDKFDYMHTCAEAVSRKSFSIYLYHILPIFILQYDVLRNVDLSMLTYVMTISSIIIILLFAYVTFPYKMFRKNR